VAVVELFTSEGCSSCPPADRVLARLVAQSQKTGQRIYPMAFHVDYWNRLGWTDRFSSAAFSDRQRDYAKSVGSGQVYTPQMIVNGAAEFVGSDSDRASREIAAALAKPQTAIVNLTLKLDHRHLRIDYTTTNAEAKTINFALVERGLSSDVARGENSGEHLKHENVVRAFEALPAKLTGHVEMELLASQKSENSSLIAFISDRSTRAISGATSADLPE
jgi:hypothetical protein